MKVDNKTALKDWFSYKYFESGSCALWIKPEFVYESLKSTDVCFTKYTWQRFCHTIS